MGQDKLHRKIAMAKAEILGLKDEQKEQIKALKERDVDLEMGERLVEEEVD